ncbi:MAG: glycosyltransferase family 2 protein [Halioglobus sp.]
MVSVHMLTYNHAPYIAKAIESVLMQEVSFDYELVIGDDCSTDETGAIVREYRDRYPGIIRLHQQKTNLGLYANQEIVRRSCRGKYIAWLEGDDFWTCSKKLQKQVSMMENHPEYSCSFHRCRWIESGLAPRIFGPPSTEPFFTLDDLLMYGHFVPTGSLVVRNHLREEYPSWMKESEIMDMSYLILFAQHGDLGFIDEVMSCYRHHRSGLFSGKDASEKVKRVMFTHELAGRNLDLNKRRSFKIGMSRMYGNLCTVQLQNRQIFRSIWSLLLSIYWSPRHRLSKIFRRLSAQR